MDFEQIITEYGYLALFIITFFEGETVLLIAGYMASRHYLELPWVIVWAFLGTFAGDQTWFYLGRFKGKALLEKFPSLNKKTPKAFDLLRRHQIKVILGFRFIYGIRNVTPFVIGISRIHPGKFFALNFLGATVWALSFGYLGFEFGHLAETILGKIQNYEKYILVALVVGGIFMFWRSTRKS